MKASDIIAQRLINHQIATTSFNRPAEIVQWLVAMQAQEFAMAKWAIGLRLPFNNKGLPVFKDADIEKAFNEGSILGTHVMRPTWHFVHPADIRWLLKLTAPRIHALNAFYYRQAELDDKLRKRCNEILVKNLEGGKHFTRSALQGALEKKKIAATGLRLALIMMNAELEGVICSGPRQGKQFTYALLEERAPAVKKISIKEALGLFTRRYFTSRGPATAQDMAYWSGLTVKEIREGIGMLGNDFVKEKVQGQEYIYLPHNFQPGTNRQPAFLMPDYDEYGISYKNRDLIINPKQVVTDRRVGNNAYYHLFVLNGKAGGSWQRTMKNKKPIVTTNAFGQLSKTGQKQLGMAIKRYNVFVNDARI